MELVCESQKYHWGIPGSKSLVARLFNANTGIVIEENVHYAELWMGTHPNAPSKIKQTNTLLSEYINNNLDVLGDATRKELGDSLPFLFKVLSVNSALSVQAHPEKKHAEVLFRDKPNLYKDPNHKPELAIALSPFKALCGFRTLEEIQHFVRIIPEFSKLLKERNIDALLSGSESGFRRCFEDLMTAPEDLVRSALNNLLSRLKMADLEIRSIQLADIVENLHNEYPGDVGVLCVYWLNYLQLQPGEALYLAPNEPHAYLNGECVECMANSDNVVRAGLTPKFRDVATLCQMLTYKHYTAEEIKFTPIQEDEHCQLFQPPVKDFAVSKLVLPVDSTYIKLINSPSILIVIEGLGTGSSTLGHVNLQFGSILFLPKLTEIKIHSSQQMIIFLASVNV